MRIRLGVEDFGGPVVVDTAEPARIVLLGPPGGGKTTTCRYVARRWRAIRSDRCLAITPRPYEYGDLRAAGVDIRNALPTPIRAGAGLLIVDEAEYIGSDVVAQALRSDYRVVLVAAFGPAVATTESAAALVTGSYAVRYQPRDPSNAVQGRLDWPPDTVPVLLDQRQRRDFPVHKWAI